MSHFGVSFLGFGGSNRRHAAGPAGEHLLGEHWSSICKEPSCSELENLDPSNNWPRWAGSSIKLHSRGHVTYIALFSSFSLYYSAASITVFNSLGPLTAWSFGFERQPTAGTHESEGESMSGGWAVTSHCDSKPMLVEVAKAGLQ